MGMHNTLHIPDHTALISLAQLSLNFDPRSLINLLQFLVDLAAICFAAFPIRNIDRLNIPMLIPSAAII